MADTYDYHLPSQVNLWLAVGKFIFLLSCIEEYTQGDVYIS